MLVPLRWFGDYIDISDVPLERLVDGLTMTGLEVDGVEIKGANFSGVVVARVDAIEPYPKADKLSCCKIFDGHDMLDVVCGASNIAVGNIVPLAKVGARLPDGYQIKSSKIRDCVSNGMLCSEEELAIGSDNSGIMILPSDLRPGDELSEALSLSDTILNVSITPNRADCYSIIGIAREVATLFGKKISHPQCDAKEGARTIADVSSVKIESPDLCSRYSAMIIGDVAIKQSPFWMRRRLEAGGIRAISNAVDVTNFVMVEMGQPLHAFDYNFLEGGRIVVRASNAGEKFVSLDGKERELKAGVLMICDAVKPVAIAGIMGGYNSEIRPDTHIVFLESAYFTPASIRRSARALGMGTDASLRFEKGIDPNGVLRALKRAAYLIAELSGGAVYQGYIDEYPQKVEVAKGVRLREKKMHAIIGIPIERAEIRKTLSTLEMSFTEDAEGFFVDPPSFRVDITREADLIEEVARIHGYDKVPTTLPAFPAKAASLSALDKAETSAREAFWGYGYSQVITYSFVSPKMVDALKLAADDRRRKLLSIRNPLVEEHGVMRTSLVYNLLQTMKSNANNDLKIFEIGKVFFANAVGELPEEKKHLGALICGMPLGLSWHSGKNILAGYYDLKGAMEGFLAALKLPKLSWVSEKAEPFLHPYRAANIFVGSEKIGFIGELHPDVANAFDLNIAPTILECDLEALAELIPAAPRFKDFSKFPASYRDVAFLLDENITLAHLEKRIAEQREELLEKTTVFDIFRGKSIPDGKKSVAIRFSYRSDEKTLTEEDIGAAHQRLVIALVEATGAKIRGE